MVAGARAAAVRRAGADGRPHARTPPVASTARTVTVTTLEQTQEHILTNI